jgi:hypothetical protein
MTLWSHRRASLKREAQRSFYGTKSPSMSDGAQNIDAVDCSADLTQKVIRF